MKSDFESVGMNQASGQTRRWFFKQCGVGMASLAMAGLDQRGNAAASSPFLPKAAHHVPRAKRVIYLFMAGGPSQLELFDYKPRLIELNGQPIPPSFLEGKRFAFMGSSHGIKLLGTRKKFSRRGQSGMWVSDLFPHTGGIVDDITMVKTCAATLFNHAPAKLFMNTGSGQFGRPSMGSWVSYGLGSSSQDLPAFVVLQSGPRGPRGGAVNWGSGFLPTTFQGVAFRNGREPILNQSNPPGITSQNQRDVLDALRDLNGTHARETGDPEIDTRIAAYEMSFRMQASAPELTDFSGESASTLAMYGADPSRPSFARNCILARRLIERGVRFVQLYHSSWDSHGGPGETLETDLEKTCREVDQAQAALIRDLKVRGLLDDTLVVWGGEFGRTPMGENRDTTGRNHHIDAFTMWFAGGGVKAGYELGQTDELGFNPVEDRVHVHDIHATILHLLGLEHTRLTYRFQGRDFRLTDIHGELVHKMMA